MATDRFSLHEVIQAERFVFDKISDILCAVTPDTLIQLFLKFVPDESERNELKRATEALMDAFILCKLNVTNSNNMSFCLYLLATLCLFLLPPYRPRLPLLFAFYNSNLHRHYCSCFQSTIQCTNL